MAARAISPWRLGVVLWCVGFIIMTLYWLNMSTPASMPCSASVLAPPMRKTVSQRMEQNESVMLSLELLMRTQSQLGMRDVQRFTQQLMQRYPHIYSIQFLKRFAQQVSAFVQRMKQRGLLIFSSKSRQLTSPQDGGRMRPRSLYHPIVIEPAGWPEQPVGHGTSMPMASTAKPCAAGEFGHMESTAPFCPPNGRGLFAGRCRAVQQHGSTRW